MENTLSFIFFQESLLTSINNGFIVSFPEFFVLFWLVFFFNKKKPTNQIVWFGISLMKEGQVNPPDKAGEGESLIKQTWTF